MFCVLINNLKCIVFFMINNNSSSNCLLKNNMCLNKIRKLIYSGSLVNFLFLTQKLLYLNFITKINALLVY
jgi:hypothetical protein